MKISVEYLFWYTTSRLVIDEGYRIIHFNEEELEVWLENQKNKQNPIIRISQRDVTWKVLVERDFEQMVNVMNQFRKELNRPKLQLTNIYLSEKPLGESGAYNYQKESKDKAILVNNYVIATDTQKEDIDKLSDVFVFGSKELLPIEAQTQMEIEKLKMNMVTHMSVNVKAPVKKTWKDQFLWTYVLIAMNALVFLAMTLMGGSTNTYVLALFGAKVNELIVAGEWWRFITPAFIHIGMTHLLMNMVSLFILGTMVEKIFGGWRFLIIYFVSGLTGVIASFVYSDSLSAGASGAIFGLFGALLYLIIKKPQIYWKTLGVNVLLLLGINLVYGFVVSSVDQYAHIGGLIGGLLAAYIVAIKGQYFDWKRWGYTLITLVIIGFFIMLGFRNVNQSTNPDTGNSVVVNYMEHGKTAEAKKVIGVMQKNNYNDNVSDFFAGNLLLKENQTTAAIANYQAAIEKEPQFPEAYYNLALAYQAEGQLKQATSAAKKASEQSNVASYKDLYDKLRTAK